MAALAWYCTCISPLLIGLSPGLERGEFMRLSLAVFGTVFGMIALVAGNIAWADPGQDENHDENQQVRIEPTKPKVTAREWLHALTHPRLYAARSNALRSHIISDLRKDSSTEETLSDTQQDLEDAQISSEARLETIRRLVAINLENQDRITELERELAAARQSAKAADAQDKDIEVEIVLDQESHDEGDTVVPGR